jgi:organic hydroperoxide reductase OsmC/OhrA
LNVNGHPVSVGSLAAAPPGDVRDPYLTHATAPTPVGDQPFDPVRKLGTVQAGDVLPFPDTVDGRLLRRVAGRAAFEAGGGIETDACLDLPGMSHFALISDDRAEGAVGPSGLGYFSAGIAFCFMTQLSRYMGAMGLDTGHLRLVQTCDYEVDAAGQGIAHPVETHLFFNGRADAETHEMLLRVAARTCYLHAALRSQLETKVTLS